MSMSMKNWVCWVMTVGSSHPATASSSHMNSSSAYFARYCEAGLDDLAISAISSLVMRVFTEISTVVMVILCQGAVRTMWTASGSHQKLNSRRFSASQSLGTMGAMLPPITTSSCASSETCGSRLMAWAMSVMGPPAEMVTSWGDLWT